MYIHHSPLSDCDMLANLWSHSSLSTADVFSLNKWHVVKYLQCNQQIQNFLCRSSPKNDQMTIPSVGIQNLVTLIFTKTTFCQCGNTKRMAHILSNSLSSRPIKTPLKSINHASKYCIYENFLYFSALFTEIQGFAWKRCSKCHNWMVFLEEMVKMTYLKWNSS